MTDELIESWIVSLNNEAFSGRIVVDYLAENVYYGEVFTESSNWQVYFIKDTSNVYVGAVVDAVGDLYWLVQTKSRKKGYLSNALKNVILPHKFLEEEKIRITITKGTVGIENYEASLKVAMRLGFQPVSDNEFVLYKSRFIDSLKAHVH
ncbi:hypothetical protein [Pontibacter oryzae]|uniref:N-acetyltransferase n=1 Tax=Pontibacter oryzae TaxID=2304593 RepID=A0A399SIW0_9BACT|nr:hypothetical protein [Pontibacter oryzae]RIJ42839.1 hypothetical protein D1627_03045 [Pontibacter oryzae]